MKSWYFQIFPLKTGNSALEHPKNALPKRNLFPQNIYPCLFFHHTFLDVGTNLWLINYSWDKFSYLLYRLVLYAFSCQQAFCIQDVFWGNVEIIHEQPVLTRPLNIFCHGQNIFCHGQKFCHRLRNYIFAFEMDGKWLFSHEKNLFHSKKLFFIIFTSKYKLF